MTSVQRNDSGNVSHLPECLTPMYDAEAWCICDRLRACEQRILLSKPNIELSAVYGYEAGRADGLDAARDAVEMAWTDDPSWDGTNWNNALYDAIAAIDALREKP